MGFLLKIGNLFVKKPLGYINGVVDTPGWKGKTGALGAMFVALAALINQINGLSPLDLNDLKELSKSEYLLAFFLALGQFGIRKKQDTIESK